MVDVRIKPLKWSEVRQPDDEIRYTHVVADSPLGRWSIEWKGWKDYDDRTVFLDGEFILNGGDDLEEAQSATLARYESIIRSTLSDAVAEREAEPVAAGYQQLKDGKWVECSYFVAFGWGSTISEGCRVVYTTPPTSELEAENARLMKERDEAINQLDSMTYDRDVNRDQCRKLLLRAEEAETRLAEAMKALDGLLEPFEGDDCRYDHHGYCQSHFLQDGDECCIKIARRVREGGKVDG